jgi:hypothetical protein
MPLSVLLCTHDPRPDDLRQTLAALRAQTLPVEEWELLLIDNASRTPLEGEPLLAWHPRGRLIREERLGLTRARRRGIAEARADLLVFCDDDNLLAEDYLEHARDLFTQHPMLGAGGGKALARYAAPLPAWAQPFAERLAVRDLGPEIRLASWSDLRSSERGYPDCAPLGAGMVLRREIALGYAATLEPSPVIADRVGGSLGSGGDCAMVLAALQADWQVGYFPGLSLVHLIPAERVTPAYLARLNRAGSESWVRLLARHGLCPWHAIARWTVPFRQARAFFRQRAWRGPAEYVSWAGACGIFEGQAGISGPDRSTRA